MPGAAQLVLDTHQLRQVNRTRWRDVVAFCVLALALGLGSERLVEHGWDPHLTLVGAYSPLLAAVIVRTLLSREGFGDAHLGVRGVRLRHWVLAVVLPILWNLPQDLFDVVSGTCELHLELVPAKLPTLPLKLLGAGVLLLGEELGWRSYLLQKLRPAGPIVAISVTAVVWFAWHPKVWWGPEATLRHDAPYLAGALFLSAAFAWLYLASGSVWPCVVLHVFNNAGSLAGWKGVLTCSAGRPLASDVVMVASLALAAGLLWSRGGLEVRRPRRSER